MNTLTTAFEALADELNKAYNQHRVAMRISVHHESYDDVASHHINIMSYISGRSLTIRPSSNGDLINICISGMSMFSRMSTQLQWSDDVCAEIVAEIDAYL